MSWPAPGGDGPAGGPAAAGFPIRVTTLELFFDLVFAFTLTQLTALLSGRETLTGTVQVLMIFGALWWMYGGYAWLTNTRPPVHAAERLLMLVAMAGFLTAGLAIPGAFGADGVAFGLGFLVVTLVHAWLYFRVNANIIRIAPFNVASALLIIAAGLVTSPARGPGPAGYLLWAVALLVLLGSPLVVHPRGLFELRPAHFVERYGALLIVALGESVAAVGIGAARSGHPDRGTGGTDAISLQLVAAAVLGLALAALLWWTIFGDGSDDLAEQVLTASSGQRRVSLALSAYFYGNIPLLLGVVAIAEGVQQAIARAAGQAAGGATAAAVVLAAGAALFLAGDVTFRRLLRIGPVAIRAGAAVAAAATVAVGLSVTIEAQLAVVSAVLAVMLAAERFLPGAGRAAGPVAAG
ncbi:MAG TPA: low temperature requirement protein A [Streptosporangiaceae bacterium]|jgi:low temperature requirement protein LtrA